VTYWDVSLVAADVDLQTRETACAAVEGVSADPAQFAYDNRWQYAAQPGWGDAWASALAAGVTDPGRDPAVITDNQILSATQQIAAG